MATIGGTHTRMQIVYDYGHWTSARAVCVVQLVSMADSRTEKLRLLLTESNNHHCIVHMYLIQLLLMSASDWRNMVHVHVTWLVFITHALWLFRWKTQVLCTCWRLKRWKVYWYMYQSISYSHYIHITFSLVCLPTWNHIYVRYSNYVYVCLPYFPDLACMYKLFARVDGGLQCIVKCLSAHLRETGRSLVTEEPGMEAPGRNATSYIQSLLDLRDQYNLFLERSFNSDQLFKHAIASVRTCVVCNYVQNIC